jgi:hypothetical protein
LATLSTVGTSQITNAAVTAAKLSGAQSGSSPVFGVRSWVNFDGSAAVLSPRASGNVSTIIDNGLGNYTVRMSTAQSDSNYCVVTGAGGPNGDARFTGSVVIDSDDWRIRLENAGASNFDLPNVYSMAIR